MTAAVQIITDNLDIWASAVKTKSAAGRGKSSKLELYGIKKLRELILELAVRGLLVPQDPNDEPASELLKKIAVEKAKLVKDKKIKKPKALPSIEDDEAPFELPAGWEWVRLGDVTNYGTCDKAEAKDADPATWVLELEDVEKVSSRLLAKVRFSERQFRSSKNVFFEGDVIYGKLRPYLDKVLVADEPGVCTTEMIPVRGYACLEPSFLRLAMKSPSFIAYANESTHGMNLPRMGTVNARLALIPLLSEAEQRRIVAKVDELMTLCDQLEQQQEASVTAHQTLVQTLLDALTTASERDDFTAAWARIAEHFDTLFTTEWSIDQLKQTILQLAVMGKLVPQDPNDEPARVLLNRMLSERKTTVANRGIRGAIPPSPPSSGDVGYVLPPTWELCALGQVTLVTDPNPSHRYPDYSGGTIPLLSTREFSGESGWNPVTAKLTTQEFWMFQKGICEFSDGDIVFARKGRLGLPRFLPQFERFSFSHTVFVIKPMSGIEPAYLLWLLRRKDVINWLTNEMNKNVGVPTLGKAKTERLPLPLPPLAEQHRIVAKVDDLMARCNRLIASLNRSQITQSKLVDAMAEQAGA